MNAVGALMMNHWTMLEAVAYSLNKYAEMCDWEPLPEEGYSPVGVFCCCCCWVCLFV